MAKVKSISQLKKDADRVFSIYVRMRDTDNGICTCITCGKQGHYKTFQAGHFVSRRVSALRFDDENVNAQCVADNMFKQGEQYLYSKALDMKYGDGTADRLMGRRFETHKFTAPELEQIIKDAKEFISWYESHN